MNFHANDPSALIETVFLRIEGERMAGMPMLNPAVRVAAVGFERRGDQGREWRGALVTPWGINLLLLPADAGWQAPDPHERVFRTYPSGTFAFLGNREEGIGDYLACPLVHDMQHFADHETAVLTAQACLAALDAAPVREECCEPESPARRRLFGLRD
jgi:[NiFe] hydrogenase assembly HybE family chaperone